MPIIALPHKVNQARNKKYIPQTYKTNLKLKFYYHAVKHKIANYNTTGNLCA